MFAALVDAFFHKWIENREKFGTIRTLIYMSICKSRNNCRWRYIAAVREGSSMLVDVEIVISFTTRKYDGSCKKLSRESRIEIGGFFFFFNRYRGKRINCRVFNVANKHHYTGQSTVVISELTENISILNLSMREILADSFGEIL